MKVKSNNIFFLGLVAVVALIIIYSISGEELSEQYEREIATFRQEKNEMFKTSDQSPLDRNQKKAFDSLDYYPINIAYKVTADFEKVPIPEVIQIQTSSNQKRNFKKLGKARFYLEGKAHSILVLKSTDKLAKDVLFVPFGDETSGFDTYGAGRYLDAELKDDKIILDFNLAYNPYCAYNPEYECPLPPKENLLDVSIMAGEKNFKSPN
ncbi:DUF1684 domain-containing protein [Flexithrix dorotheae]|uniref:DUF1684 domain-containing protein n=1 Tax=Flexithrix dorotheae TaxID=70993 RepID=UPI00037C742E|nr:DUF1684 domain-containing protein [Flexithrix dorotheae]